MLHAGGREDLAEPRLGDLAHEQHRPHALEALANLCGYVVDMGAHSVLAWIVFPLSSSWFPLGFSWYIAAP
jgi:hypothetical protein